MKELVFAPHLPADWNSLHLGHVAMTTGTVDLDYSRTIDSITLNAAGNAGGFIEFSPAISPRAQVLSAQLNGQKVPYRIESSPTDQHVEVTASLNGKAVIVIHIKNDFQLGVPADLPALGSTSQNIKPISQTWTDDQVEYVFEGLGGHTYDLPVRGLDVASMVTGAQRHGDHLSVTFPAGHGYVKQNVVVRFK